ncbi:MAG: type II toxin-antitoxin system HicA family toxin [Chloroflexota bacterium]|nr:type II toxin-antitoxin system HicA family toxin [Chloroflexota bacterium]
MAPLRPLPFREVKRKLESVGFAEVTQKGSHVKFVRSTPDGTRTAVVPRHREVAVGTLRSILRQAGLSDDEFDRL